MPFISISVGILLGSSVRSEILISELESVGVLLIISVTVISVASQRSLSRSYLMSTDNMALLSSLNKFEILVSKLREVDVPF